VNNALKLLYTELGNYLDGWQSAGR